jgi:hypothetical protein
MPAVRRGELPSLSGVSEKLLETIEDRHIEADPDLREKYAGLQADADDEAATKRALSIAVEAVAGVCSVPRPSQLEGESEGSEPETTPEKGDAALATSEDDNTVGRSL